MLALVVAFFAVQAGYQGFTAALPVALVKAGLPDAEIGLIVGVASVVQVPAAFFAGGLIDRFGGPRVLLLGALAYLGGAVLLTLPMAAPGAVGAVPFFVAARVLQGIGVSTCTPAAFAIVPGLVDRSRVGVGLAQAGAAQNLTMAFLPPVSLFVLDAVGLQGVAAGIAVVVAVGAVLTVLLGRSLVARGDTGMARDGAGAGAAEATRPRWLGFAWRSAWTLPLLIVVAMTVHWGVVTSYLAQVAEPAGVNVGIFFTLDAVGVLVLRIPVGWLVDRVPPRPFLLAGIVGLLACVSLTLLPPTLPTLIVAGFLAGAGGVLVVAPMLMVMSHRSGDRDRGSAFAFFYVAMALGNAIGSIGGAPLFAAGGFALAMAALGITGLVVSALLTFADPGLGQRSGIVGRPAVVAATLAVD
jgi:MFS family permease